MDLAPQLFAKSIIYELIEFELEIVFPAAGSAMMMGEFGLDETTA
jgi:hypothetical protein